MNQTEQNFNEAVHQWLHIMPLDELPPIINLICMRFRNGECNEQCALGMLEKFRGMVLQWHDHNSTIAKMMDQIPDME
jgi:hypothetical protein